MNNNFFLDKIDYYNALLKDSFDPVLLIKDFQFIDCNDAALKVLNIDNKEELIRIHPSEISPKYQPDGQLSKEKANNLIKKAYKNGSTRFEWLHSTIDNKKFWVEVTLNVININSEDLLFVLWRDIEKRKRYEQDIKIQNNQLVQNNTYIKQINTILQNENEDETSENLIESLSLLEEYKKAIDESSIVSKTDLNGVITYVNDKFCSISGYKKEELLGKNHNLIRHPDMKKEVFKELWETIQNKKVFKAIIKNKKKDGSSYYVDSTIIPILDKNSNIKEYIGIRHDISSVYEKDKIISKQSTDELTNLPNRTRLIQDLTNVTQPKLALIDIDCFKDLNDTYGMQIGDKLLKLFSKTLLKFKIDNLNIYRVSGDIFAFLAHDKLSFEDLQSKCEKLVEYLDKTDLIINDDTFNLSVTIGIASETTNIMAHTEMALTYAKKKNIGISVFRDDINLQEKLKQNIDFTKKIKTALKKDKILMFGQKIINNQTGEVKFETLMRMKQEDGEIISPFRFLEHAKKAKLYPQMTRVMIEKACSYFKDKNHMFSLNLTIQDITNKQTMDFLIQKLKETKTANKVILEIVESEGIEQFQEVSSFINKMKKLGCKIAIDDFGTGYSNFEYIIKLNVDILKIDGSLIKDLETNRNLFITVSTIVSFAKQLDIEVVAEFVHSEVILKIVKDLGITHSQGFYLHEPQYLK